MTTLLNHAPRQSLAQQIDRLDRILDGLADAIPASVAEAVQHGVAAGVQAALADALTRPELLAALAAAAERPGIAAAQPSLVRRAWNWCRNTTASVCAMAAQTVQTAMHQVGEILHAIVGQARKATHAVRSGWRSLFVRLARGPQFTCLLGAIALALAGSAVSATVRLIRNKAAALGEKIGTLLVPLGRWAVVVLLTLDLAGTVVALASSPVLTLVLALSTRLAISSLVLASWGLPFARRAHTSVRPTI